MSRFVKAGARVFRRARTNPKGRGMSYPAGRVVLLEDARIGPDAGWDVVDVRLDDGEESSAYSFDLNRTAPETAALTQARRAAEHASKLSTQATRWTDVDLFDADPERYWLTSRDHQLDAAEAYEVAADAYEEAGNMRLARGYRKRAKERRDVAARHSEEAEKARRIMRTSPTWAGKRLRDSRRRTR